MRRRFFPVFVLMCLAALSAPARAADVLMIGANADPSFGDDGAVFDYLTATLGHDVNYLAAAAATLDDGAEADLIVVSSTLGSGDVRGKFTGLDVPMLNWEEAIMDGTTAAGNLAMGAGSENGTANLGTEIRILNSAHPLAAGLSGVVQIATDPIPRPHISGSVAPGVTAVASLPGVNDVVPIESGIGVHLGSTQTGGNPFSGYMDEMAIWERSLNFQVNANRELIGGEVFDVYKTGVSSHAQGLVGYWPFDDVADADVAADSSGNAYDASITGGATKTATTKAPGVGGAASLEVDGTQQVDAIDTVRPGGELTYSFWFNADSSVYGPEFDTADARVDFFYGDGVGGVVRPHLSANRNGRPVGLYLSDGADIAQPIEATTTSFTADEWHHVLITWDGAQGSVFVDGVLNNQEDFTGGTLFAITAVDAGGELTDGTTAPAQIVNFPIQDVGFASLTDDGLKLFDAAIAWLLDTGVAVPGDFDGDGVLSQADIDLLNQAVAGGGNASPFDLSGDGNVDKADIDRWIVDLKKTWIGDANLDGEFNSGDFVAIFTTGKFEQDVAANWGEGDWNGDLRFNSGDFVAAFQGGGYEQGPRAAVSAVPEPASCTLSILGLSSFIMLRRRR